MLHEEVTLNIAFSKDEEIQPKPGIFASMIGSSLPLFFCLIITVVLRLWLISRTHAFIDADEAIVGIQAQHILQGEFPIYYYGQPYMGSLEAYLIALLFMITGPTSSWAMRLEPTLLSLILIWLTWKLAGALADQAKLQEPHKHWFMALSALFATVPPLYDTIIQLRAWGGHIEIYLVMLGLLYCTLRLTQRWEAHASLAEIIWRWSVIGFLTGLGMWIYPLVMIALITAAFWILGFFALTLIRIRHHSSAPSPKPDQSARFHIQRLLLVFTGIPAALLGFAPALFWGARHNWANIAYLLSSNQPPGIQEHYPTRFAVLQGTVRLYTTCIAPRVVGGIASNTSKIFIILFASLGLLCIGAAVGLVLLSYVRKQTVLFQTKQLVALPLIFGGCSALLFCLSPISSGGLLYPCVRDEAGRYAAPLNLALPFILAALAIFLYLAATTHHATLSANHQPSPITRPDRLHQSALIMITLFVILNLGLRIQPYIHTNAKETFQSFACKFELDDQANEALITYLRQHHITYIWASMWIGNSIAFQTHEEIITADPRVITVNARDRLPANTQAVLHAKQASILAFVGHDDQQPQILDELSKKQVVYQTARFPTGSSDSTDVLLITPLNQSVSPSDANSLGSWAFGC